ncbi:FAD:protein FMN transferase [Shewanella maritima]|uniref:FAD:protein FMN transferase n=1 Tax=Shewanella maritima TaxID=2520507 RepID=UPI0037366A97
MINRFVQAVVLLILLMSISACGEQTKLVSLSGNTMGTTYSIKVVPSERLPQPQLLQAEIDLALEAVNNQMSTYRPNSELTRFNQLNPGQSLPISADTAYVINEAIRLYDVTDGALDVTLGPLINLWGFGEDSKPTKVPTQNKIDIAKTQMGMDGFSLHSGSLKKSHPALKINLSAIAKGFGVDKVANILNKYQVSGYLVEIGGELSVKGVKADGTPWRIAVEKPNSQGARIQQVIEPGTMAVATSGDYRNYFEENGERFSHLIDPRNGYPIKHNLASATVLHPSSMTADAYATAMMVLGTQASLDLAQKQDLPVMLIEKAEQGYEVFYSEAFKPYIK